MIDINEINEQAVNLGNSRETISALVIAQSNLAIAEAILETGNHIYKGLVHISDSLDKMKYKSRHLIFGKYKL